MPAAYAVCVGAQFLHVLSLQLRDAVFCRYNDRAKVDADVAAAGLEPTSVTERVNVISQASFPWRHVTQLRATAWFSEARSEFKRATKTDYGTSCMLEMVLLLRSALTGGSTGIFNPSRVHDKHTWEGHAASVFHAHINSGGSLALDEEYDLPASLLEHAVSAVRAALVAGRNSRGLVCTCGAASDARETYATTDAAAEAFAPACTCPGWEADRGAGLIPALLVDKAFVDPIIRTLMDSSGPWRAFLTDSPTAHLVLVRRSLGTVLSSDNGPIVYSNVDSRLASPSLHDVLGFSRVLKLAAVFATSSDGDASVHREALRQVELLTTLEANLRNPVVGRVLYFTDSTEEAAWLRLQIPPPLLPKLDTRSLGRQMMYSDALQAANELFESSWTIVLNADIVIGAEWANSAELPSAIEARAQRRMYMLSRNEMWTKKFGAGCCSSSNYNGCHDGFAFVPPVSSDLISRARFHQNHWGAENRLAWEMTQLPDALIPGNPCMSLPVYHNHASQLRPNQHGRCVAVCICSLVFACLVHLLCCLAFIAS